MNCARTVDLHVDAAYRRQTTEDGIQKGYGLRGLNVIRRGFHNHIPIVHLVESVSKSLRLAVRSSYSSELIGAAHGFDDAYPTLVTLHELNHGVLSPSQLRSFRENGGIKIDVTLTVDAESVFKSLSSKDLKVPAERTLLGHISWLREAIQLGLIDKLCWCDTRDMTADGHTKGSIDRRGILDLMNGWQGYQHKPQVYKPFRASKKMEAGKTVTFT